MRYLPRLISFSFALAGVALFLKDDTPGAIATAVFAIYLRLVEPQTPSHP